MKRPTLISLRGTLLNAATNLDRLVVLTGGDDLTQGDYYASALREIARHAEQVENGESSLIDFASFYCLCPRRSPPTNLGNAQADRESGEAMACMRLLLLADWFDRETPNHPEWKSDEVQRDLRDLASRISKSAVAKAESQQ